MTLKEKCAILIKELQVKWDTNFTMFSPWLYSAVALSGGLVDTAGT
jgi:hypothetical protein